MNSERAWSGKDWILAAVLGVVLLLAAVLAFSGGDTAQGWLLLGLFVVGIPLVLSVRKRRSR